MTMLTKDFLQDLGIKKQNSGTCVGGQAWLEDSNSQTITSFNPSNGESIAQVELCSEKNYQEVIKQAEEAFKEWRLVPAPKRGEVVRLIGEELRKNKDALGSLVAYEMGKIKQEGDGEVQEMIDIADFAVGLSRQLYGLTMHSERPFHRMYEQWHPLGIVGIISAFNFPVAVWAWNACLAAVCGNVSVWKPSSKTPLCAIAVQNICNTVLEKEGYPGIFNVIVCPGKTVGEAMVNDKRIPLISATGSTDMGRHIAQAVSKRLGRHLLELGGNNALIVDESADLKLVIPAIVFGAVGTAGQRCTSTRRVIIHKSKFDLIAKKLVQAYKQVKIGDPLQKETLMGPLIDQAAVDTYTTALEKVQAEGGEILCGGNVLQKNGYFVEPTIVKVKSSYKIVKEETFAPILYLMEYTSLEEALHYNNDVPQGLSSAMFTENLKCAETFLSHVGSDCGIANINIGTSGAEIGGAFGGEKETGGGREAGSDSWRAYMRRQTTTINWSNELPLAQGIEFNLN